MTRYKISVIVPTYNSGLFLNSFMDSMMYQSIGFENIQIIFVDDNSTDEYTLSLLKLFEENYSNVKSILLDENSGFPGKGRNIGIDSSDADYVIFSDHDDTYMPNSFEVMYNTISENDADFVITNYYKVFGDEKVKVESVFGNEHIHVNDFKEDLRLFSLDPSIWTKIFKKQFLIDNNIRFLEGMLAEDLYVFVVSLVKSKSTIYLADFYSYNYYIRNVEGNKSTIHIRSAKYLYKMIEGYRKVNEFLEENNLQEYYSDVFRLHFVYWLTSLILSDLSNDDKEFLIKNINDLFKKQLEIAGGFDEKIYGSLYEPILNDDYNKIVKNINSIKLKRNIVGFFSNKFKKSSS